MLGYEGTLKFVKGDVTKPQYTKENEIAIIPHVANDLGVMGSGVALGLKRAFAGVEYYYRKSGHTLGTNSWVNPNSERNNVIVVNMVAQKGTYNENNPIPIKYAALVKCMEDLVKDVINPIYTEDKYKGKIPVIHMPEFGSLRAGGDFGFIKELVREIWIEQGIDVVIYQYDG